LFFHSISETKRKDPKLRDIARVTVPIIRLAKATHLTHSSLKSPKAVRGNNLCPCKTALKKGQSKPRRAKAIAATIKDFPSTSATEER